MIQQTTDFAGRKPISNNKEWNTPPKLVKAITEFFGTIHLDPCSNQFSTVNAIVQYDLLKGLDGLKESWSFKNIFVNPPYGRNEATKTTIKDWLRRCEHANFYNKSNVIALIPVATNTSHWKEFIFKKATAICFLSDTRLKFYENGIEQKKGAPMACCLVYWASKEFDSGEYTYDKFGNHFQSFGNIVKP